MFIFYVVCLLCCAGLLSLLSQRKSELSARKTFVRQFPIGDFFGRYSKDVFRTQQARVGNTRALRGANSWR